MKKVKYFLIIMLILIIIFLIFYKTPSNIFEDITIFSLWNENEYVINAKSNDKIQINVFNQINNQNKKIAPGSSGNFKIKLIKPDETSCTVNIKEITSKPKNLIFMLDGKKYNSITEMQEAINQKLEKMDYVKINWEWEYDISQEDDLEDTEDGEKAQKYIFEVEAIIE